MKSRKLRALALALSAIMTITAVPSTLFAEDFFVGAAEEDGWDSEIVADVEAPAEVFDDFDDAFASEVFVDEEIFDEGDFIVEAGNGIAQEDWNSADKIVTITYKDGLKKDFKADSKPSATDCTKSYLFAKVDDGLGGVANYEIQSNIAKIYRDSTADSDVYLNGTKVVEGGAGEKGGVYPNGEVHDWDMDHPEVEYEAFSCVGDNVYYLKYTCKKCTTVTYDPTVKEQATEKSESLKKTVKGEGHKKPADASAIKVTYLCGETSNADYSGELKVENSVLKNSVPVAINSAKDAFWVVRSTYICEVCHKEVNEDVQGSQLVRKIAYTNLSDNMATPNLTPAPSDPKTYLGTEGKDWSTDKSKFQLSECLNTKGVAEKGTYDEVWYTGEWDGEKTIVYTVSHEVEAHNSKKTVYMTVGTVEDKTAPIKVSNTALGQLLSTEEEDLAKIASLSYKANTTSGADNVTGVASSLSCLPISYYEVVQCKICNRVLSVTKKEAAGNDKAHKYSEGVTYIISAVPKKDDKGTVIGTKNPATDLFTEDELTAAEKKGGVSFENKTYDCTNDGTVDMYYVCPLCKKEHILYGTIKVQHPDHKFVWVDIDPKQDPTCTEDGFVTQQSQCKVCKTINPNEQVRKATVPKLNHAGVEKEKALYISLANGGDIVGTPEWTVGTEIVNVTDTTGEKDKYDNIAVVGAKVYKICPICSKPVYDSNSSDNPVAEKDKDWGKKIKLTAESINKLTNRCNNGTIVVKAVLTDDDKVTATGTFDYWNNINAYQARTNHTAVQKADGSVVCAVCGVVLAEAPVVTTEPTTETTTEAKPETTTVAPQAETTTVAPQPETTTVAPQPETTTVAPQPETTTVAPQPETTTVEPVSETTTEAPATMPAQVTGEKVTKNSPTKGIIGVKYNAVEGADSYTVNVREPNGTWTKNPTDGAETAYEITGLTRGKLYDIRIAAVAAGIAGPRSAHLYRWLEKVTLDKPTKIKGEAGAVNVTWTAADGASKYKLYWSTDKAFKTDVKKDVFTENTAKITGLKTGTRYYFKVRCYTKGADDKTYTGGWSNVRSKILK